MKNTKGFDNEPIQQTLSHEEIKIEALISNLEDSENPTLDMIILLELLHQHITKTAIHQNTTKGAKGIFSGRYTSNDSLPSESLVVNKVMSSKLEKDEKALLLHLYGDTSPGGTMATWIKSKADVIPKAKEQDSNLSNDNSLHL